MPIFIDRHKFPNTITAETAALAHLNDLKIQHKYNCRKLSYWFDEEQKTAFCLFEAPDKDCMIEMHKHAHNNIPNQIIEVEKSIIDSFVKQIQRLPNIEKLQLPGALPTFLACDLGTNSSISNRSQLKSIHKNYISSVKEAINNFGGNIISRIGTFFLIAFQSGPAAIKCALKMHKIFNANKTLSAHKYQLKIGVCGGIEGDKEGDEIKASVRLAKRLCYMAHKNILVTLEVKNLFQSESTKVIFKGDRIKSVSPDDVRFITLLLNYMESNWKNHELHASDFEEHLGCSKSQIYRKMMDLVHQSPNAFIKEYRLNRAIEMLRQRKGNISEIAFDAGFSSPSYFSKCFHKEYGLKPSDYLITTEHY